MKRRILVGAAGAVVILIAVANPARAANPPVHQPVASTSTALVTNLCTFPLTVTFQFTGERTSFFDMNGVLTRIVEHGVEHDTYTANGHTLEGLPYTFNVQGALDSSGDFTSLYTSGLVGRVPLPDGTVFQAAGRIDFLAHSFQFVAVPDWGTPVNTDALCAALTA